MTITYTKLTWQTYEALIILGTFSQQILKCILPLESGNLQLEQTKFPVFWQNFQIPYVFPDRDPPPPIFPVFPVQWVSCTGSTDLLDGSMDLCPGGDPGCGLLQNLHVVLHLGVEVTALGVRTERT